MKKILLHFVFLIVVLGDLVGQWTGNTILDYTFKPLIMIWIAGYFLLHSKAIDRKIFIMKGLIKQYE